MTGRWVSWRDDDREIGPGVCNDCFEAIFWVSEFGAELTALDVSGKPHACPPQKNSPTLWPGNPTHKSP